MKNLQLSLINVWFQKTKTGEVTEDYREITPYWCNRFLLFDGETKTKYWWKNEYFDFETIEEIIDTIKTCCTFKPFKNNIVTVGSFSKTKGNELALFLEHKGIEISTGKTEWGAEANKQYFVIKHGTESYEA